MSPRKFLIEVLGLLGKLPRCIIVIYEGKQARETVRIYVPDECPHGGSGTTSGMFHVTSDRRRDC